jgi:methyl-accepting chemotaxis protein
MTKDVKLIEECLERLSKGDLSLDVNVALLKKGNDTGKIVRLIQQITENQRAKSVAIAKISKGDFKSVVFSKTPNDHDELSNSINKLASNLQFVENGFQSMSDDFDAGNTELEIDESRYSGGFMRITASVNHIINSITAPLIESGKVIAAMSVNDFTQRVTGEYVGKFKELTQNINLLCDRFNEIEGTIVKISKGDVSDAALYKEIANLVENIAVASNEQATGIAQVNQGLEQVSKVVQTNSATAEQSAAASEELSGQSNLLKSNVEKFTLRASTTKHSGNDHKAVDVVQKVKQATESPKRTISLNESFGKY